MEPVTRLELQRQLEGIKLSQTGLSSSPLRYYSAWTGLIAAIVVIALWFLVQAEASRSVIPFIAVVIGTRSLYAIIRYDVMKPLRPILEALLYIPQDLPKQEISKNSSTKKRSSARPRRR